MDILTKLNLSSDSITQRSLVIGLILLSTVVYCVYKLIYYFLDKNKKPYFLNIIFPDKEVFDTSDKVVAFFESLHSLSTSSRISILFKKSTKHLKLYLASPSLETIESIKKFLTSFEGIKYAEEKVEMDLLPYSRKIVMSNCFGNIKVTPNEFFSQFINVLSSLDEDNEINIAINFQGIDFVSKIDAKLEKRALRLQKSKRNIEQDEKYKQLLLKRVYGNFNAIIKVNSNKSRNIENISALTKSLNSSTSFSSKPLKIKSLTELFTIPQLTVLSFWLSWKNRCILNSQELSNFFLPQNFKRGIFEQNQSVVLESSKEFTSKEETNFLIGRSVLKTGLVTDIFLPLKNLERHVYLVGKTGMGKSSTMINIFLNLAELKLNSSLIMFDPHGADLIKIAERLGQRERIVYLDLSTSENVFTFNPLFSYRSSLKEKETRSEEILSILQEESANRNKDLGTSIEKLLSFLITVACHFPDAYDQYLTSKLGLSSEDAAKQVEEKQITFNDLTKIISDGPNSFKVIIDKVFEEYPFPIAWKWKNELNTFSINKAILDGIDNRLKFLLKDSLVPIFEGSKLNLRQIINQNKILLIPLTINSFGRISRKIITKLFLAELWFYAQSINDEAKRKEVFVMIDEFQNAQIDIVDQLLSEARKYKIRMIFGNQYFGQLNESIRSSVMGNVSTLFAFNIGNTEEAKMIPPLFRNSITEEDVAGLPPFTAYMKTLGTDISSGNAFITFNTIDYATHYQTINDNESIEKTISSSLLQYGEPLSVIYERIKNKQSNPLKYFFESKTNNDSQGTEEEKEVFEF